MDLARLGKTIVAVVVVVAVGSLLLCWTKFNARSIQQSIKSDDRHLRTIVGWKSRNLLAEFLDNIDVVLVSDLIDDDDFV